MEVTAVHTTKSLWVCILHCVNAGRDTRTCAYKHRLADGSMNMSQLLSFRKAGESTPPWGGRGRGGRVGCAPAFCWLSGTGAAKLLALCKTLHKTLQESPKPQAEMLFWQSQLAINPTRLPDLQWGTPEALHYLKPGRKKVKKKFENKKEGLVTLRLHL